MDTYHPHDRIKNAQIYWYHEGLYQKQYDTNIISIPVKGRSDSIPIELLRCACNLYYDYYNNGFCNLNSRQSDLNYIKEFHQKFDAYSEDIDIELFDNFIDICELSISSLNYEYVVGTDSDSDSENESLLIPPSNSQDVDALNFKQTLEEIIDVILLHIW